MPTVQFTSHLKAFFKLPESMEVPGTSVREVLDNLEMHFPGLKTYVCDERGALRPHVHIFLNQAVIVDRDHLSDPVLESDRLFILQALSGG